MPSPVQLMCALPSFAREAPDHWDRIRIRATVADAAGFDRVVVPDHVAFGERLDAYADPRVGGVEDGRQPTGPDGHWLEPLIVLAFVAAITARVRLGTNILIAALRRPAVLAKQLATLDVLSGGRVDFGVGVGWQREEYAACGLDFAGRGRLLDHTLDVCRTLWGQTRASFADDLLQFEAVHQMPKPAQAGGPPIWVSGTVNERVARRLATHGSGWIPWGAAAADLPSSIPAMRAAVQSFGRGDAAGLRVVGHLVSRRRGGEFDAEATVASARPLIDAGVTELWVHPPFVDDLVADVATARDLVRVFGEARASWGGP